MVVTFTIPCTLVTILGLICAYSGIAPYAGEGLQPSSNFIQLADVLASAFIGYQLMLIVEILYIASFQLNSFANSALEFVNLAPDNL